ncbi:MAG: dipeptide/oligopeptide/nickel ABC transporter ATP-binding protein [Candidatus Sulfotelmatobacter sp.]
MTKLAKRYVRGGLWGRRVAVVAVNGVDLEIPSGQTLALVGESGSGKSTVARCVARLEKPDSGQIWIGEKNAADIGSGSRLLLRGEVQMVFQDPVTSMNLRFTAAEVVEEPLLIQGLNRERRRKVALESIDEVGLSRAWVDRFVMQFSGGQRQRLAIARALVLRPKLLVLDEAITGLDLSAQAQIANLLLALQASYSLTYLLISHDLALVARMADAIAVMAHGRIVETGPTSQMMTAPKKEEAIRLLASARAAQSRLDAITEESA